MVQFLLFAGTGRWSSPCTSLGFHRHRWLPSRFLQRTYARPKPLAALHDLDATTRDAHSAREPRHPKAPQLTSSSKFHSPLHRSCLTGRHLAQRSPAEAGGRCLPCSIAPAQRRCVHSHRPERRLRRAGTTQYVPFHPCGLSPLRRFAPQRICRFVAPCCRSWGSTRFAVRATFGQVRRSSLLIPVSHVRTLQRMPPIDSRTVSPRPLPPWRSHSFERHFACSRQANPAFHRSSCVWSEDPTATFVARLGVPLMPVGMIAVPLWRLNPERPSAPRPCARVSHDLLPAARASHQPTDHRSGRSSPPRGGPRGRVHAGGKTLARPPHSPEASMPRPPPLRRGMGPMFQQAEPCFWCEHHRRPKPPPLLAKRPNPMVHPGRDPPFDLPPRCLVCRPPKWPTATPHVALVTHRSARDPKVGCVCTPRSQPESLIPGVASARRPPPANDESPARTCPRDDAVRFCCSLLPGCTSVVPSQAARHQSPPRPRARLALPPKWSRPAVSPS
jgi:hypothetical protein